jgi:hypothetical protein
LIEVALPNLKYHKTQINENNTIVFLTLNQTFFFNRYLWVFTNGQYRYKTISIMQPCINVIHKVYFQTLKELTIIADSEHDRLFLKDESCNL